MTSGAIKNLIVRPSAPRYVLAGPLRLRAGGASQTDARAPKTPSQASARQRDDGALVELSQREQVSSSLAARCYDRHALGEFSLFSLSGRLPIQKGREAVGYMATVTSKVCAARKARNSDTSAAGLTDFAGSGGVGHWWCCNDQ